jgi:hypothetical protein
MPVNRLEEAAEVARKLTLAIGVRVLVTHAPGIPRPHPMPAAALL